MRNIGRARPLLVLTGDRGMRFLHQVIDN